MVVRRNNFMKKGFTLIELMIAISIVIILSVVGFVVFSSTQAKARDGKRVQDLQQIQVALEEYYQDHGSYPSSLGLLAPSTGKKYLATIPSDPKTNLPYSDFSTIDCSGNNCKSYEIKAVSETNSGADPTDKSHFTGTPVTTVAMAVSGGSGSVPTPVSGSSPVPTGGSTPVPTATVAPTATPAPCTLASAFWTAAPQVTVGQTVTFRVVGQGDCTGKQVALEVRRYGSAFLDDIPANNQPSSPVAMPAPPLNYVIPSWVAEYNPLIPFTNPTYYFKATVSGGNTIRSATPDLVVLPASTPVPTPTVAPTPTSTPTLTLAKDSHNPVVVGFSRNPWYTSYDAAVADPAVIYDGGQYKMYFTASGFTSSTDTRSVTRIGYASSTDGINWDRSIGHPVLDIGPSDAWDSYGLETVWVLKDTSNYKMYYAGYDNVNRSSTQIGLATSTDGINWTKSTSNPILTVDGSWEAWGIWGPVVLKDGSTYKMWYLGVGSDLHGRLGYATSSDGITWNKQGKVLDTGNSGSWDSIMLSDFGIVKSTSGTYYLFYSGSKDGTNANDSQNYDIGLATSTDGITWTKSTSNPVLTRGGAGSFDETSAMAPSVLMSGNFVAMWYHGLNKVNPANQSSWLWGIGLATGTLP